jgi:hypothetical protein
MKHSRLNSHNIRQRKGKQERKIPKGKECTLYIKGHFSRRTKRKMRSDNGAVPHSSQVFKETRDPILKTRPKDICHSKPAIENIEQIRSCLPPFFFNKKTNKRTPRELVDWCLRHSLTQKEMRQVKFRVTELTWTVWHAKQGVASQVSNKNNHNTRVLKGNLTKELPKRRWNYARGEHQTSATSDRPVRKHARRIHKKKGGSIDEVQQY